MCMREALVAYVYIFNGLDGVRNTEIVCEYIVRHVRLALARSTNS